MSDDANSPVPAPTRSNSFFRSSRAVPLARDAAKRQGEITSLAFLAMGGRDPALAFLNGENEALGGRPLAIASASAEGYAAVVAAIRAAHPAPGGA